LLSPEVQIEFLHRRGELQKIFIRVFDGEIKILDE